jgi:hypothetical protein
MAVCMASRKVGTMSHRRRIVTQYLQIGRNNAIWSMSCRAPRPFNRVAAAPPINSNGLSAICAFFTAVTVFVRPVTRFTVANVCALKHQVLPSLQLRQSIASAARWRRRRRRQSLHAVCQPHEYLCRGCKYRLPAHGRTNVLASNKYRRNVSTDQCEDRLNIVRFEHLCNEQATM